MELTYKSFPIRRLTPADGQYFFGYYDLKAVKGDLHLAHRTDFYNRLHVKGDSAQIGIVDMKRQSFECLDTTEAWCFQQGSMLQWNPGSSADEIVYNCFDGADYFATVMNINSGVKRFIDRPIANLSRDGKWAISINFDRLYDFRPGYGYACRGDSFAHVNHGADDGIFLTDMESGKSRLVISMQEIWDFCGGYFGNADQKLVVNHITFNTDATRFLFLVRNFPEPGKRHSTALITANRDGSDMYLLSDFGMQSHYYWVDSERVIFYADGKELECSVGWNNYILKDKTHEGSLVAGGHFKSDNHMSFSPNGKYLLSDCYPDKNRMQSVCVSDLQRNIAVNIGSFYSLPTDIIDCRCDLHPRWSADGSLITFDSTHEGYRGIYAVDAAPICEFIDAL